MSKKCKKIRLISMFLVTCIISIIMNTSAFHSKIAFAADKTKPKVTLKKSTNKNTAKPVKVTVTATDKSGIKKIEYKSGEFKKASDKYWKNSIDITKKKSFEVTENWTYSVRVTDKSGNKTAKTVKISNIVKNADNLEAIYPWLKNYSKFGTYSEGLIPVCKNGYWGYVDLKNKVKIDFYFNDASSFINGRAVVKGQDKYGVIDKKGNYIVKPEFSKITISDMFIIAEKSAYYGWGSGTHYWEYLFDIDGKVLIPDPCNKIMIGDNNRISAELYVDRVVTHRSNFINKIYDYEGNVISTIDKYGRIGKFSEGKSTFKKLGDEIYYSMGYTSTTLYDGMYVYLNSEGDIISPRYVTASDFKNNIALVSTGVCSKNGSIISAEDVQWLLIDENFNMILELGSGEFMCESIFGNYVIKKYSPNYYTIVNINTYDEYGPFSKITKVSDTHCIIVVDYNTGYHGLVNGDNFIYDLEYNKIEYAGLGKFILTKGGTKTTIEIPLVELEKVDLN